ncbi:PHD finger protein ING1-like [Rutidosis leptorrhynchoides]|uniref:PHD finger protein ING1-like n=1 Tax=Rutidosis leptorrhynchoides TaxID=125765 RepID=UPI003A99F4E5
MSSFDEFEANLESLPTILQKKYALLHDLDKSLQEIQRQNVNLCEQEIDDIKRGVRVGNFMPGTSLVRFSDDALDEQKHGVRIADEKVVLAVQAYDLVDTHAQQLDQYLKNLDEELRRERESAAANVQPPSSINDGVAKSGRGNEGGRGNRKKTRLVTAVATEAATSIPSGMELDLPVDPNEPTYCYCNQVNFGDMVACDNPECKVEWFHFACVGLKETPKGKWYCSDCAVLKNQRRGR